jgi:hypothetical protein
MIRCLTSKSETSHCRKEAALKKWLAEDIRNPRRKGVAISGRFSFEKMLLKMG